MSPLKIGFITSLLLHSLLAVAILTKQDNTLQISKRSNKTIAISLENINNKIENQPINQQKKQEKPKKQYTQNIYKKHGIKLAGTTAEDIKDIKRAIDKIFFEFNINLK